MSEPKYRATVTVEKITPKRGSVGFSAEEPKPASTEEIGHFVINDGALDGLKGKVAEHLNLVKE